MVKDSALIQNTLLMLPKVRRSLDIPKVLSEKEKLVGNSVPKNKGLSGIAKKDEVFSALLTTNLRC